jgi:hypothetical protein
VCAARQTTSPEHRHRVETEPMKARSPSEPQKIFDSRDPAQDRTGVALNGLLLL